MIAVTLREEESVSTELIPHSTSCTTSGASTTRTCQEQLPRNLTLHVGREDALLERVTSASQRTELILSPVELHRRNIQRRLREAQTSKDGVLLAAPSEVGQRLLDVRECPTTTIDRIDRLSMIQSVLSNTEESITAPAVPSKPQTVEQIRTIIENVTGFHPTRVEILRETADDLTAPLDANVTELLSAAVAIERALRRRTSKSIADDAVIRRAVRELLSTDGDRWQDAFPDVDCVSLVGVSSVSAAQIDLLHGVLNSVSLSVHVHFRRGTGSYLARRVPELLDVAEPGTVVFES